jgi:hypothetical protein
MADVEKDIVLRVKSDTQQATGQFKTLKQELKSIENELNRMSEAGEEGSDAFRKLQARAGQVKDQINDTKGAIKALSSDTFRLDAFSQAAQGIAGGFAAAQGAMALFGSENKAVEEGIKKTQGAMALLQGVTAITNILQKESAFRLAVSSAAQAAYTAVVGTSTGAMKLFRLALASTGIGALVVGLGLLIANFDDVKKVVLNLIKPFDGIIAKVRDFLSVISFGLIDDASTAKTKSNAEASLEAINKLTKANESIEKQMQRNIDIAKAKGKSDREVYQLEKQLLEFRLKNNYAEQDAIKKKIAVGNATEEERKKLFELVQSARDLLKDKTVLEINYTNKQKEETAKRIDNAKKEAEAKQKELENLRSYEEKYEKERKEKAEKEAKDAEDRAKEQREFEDNERKMALDADREYFKNYMDSKRFNDQQKKDQAKQSYLDGIISEKEYQEALSQIDQQGQQRRMNNLKMVSDSLQALSDLTTALAGKSEESQRKAFKVNKAFQLSQALINTYMAVTGALTAGGNPIKLATGAQFVEAGIALTTGLAQVAKIAKTQFNSSASGSSAGGSMGGSLGSVPTPSYQAQQTQTIGSTQLQLDAQGNLLQQRSMRTYVLETDISEKQSRSRRLQQTATLGK